MPIEFEITQMFKTSQKLVKGLYQGLQLVFCKVYKSFRWFCKGSQGALRI